MYEIKMHEFTSSDHPPQAGCIAIAAVRATMMRCGEGKKATQFQKNRCTRMMPQEGSRTKEAEVAILKDMEDH
jgi:hypothetical protein